MPGIDPLIAYLARRFDSESGDYLYWTGTRWSPNPAYAKEFLSSGQATSYINTVSDAIGVEIVQVTR